MNFDVQGDITDVITHAKFYVNQGFGGSDPPLLRYSVDLAGRCYNNV